MDAKLLEQIQSAGEELRLPNGLRFSSLDKELWPRANGEPAVTKRDLVAYYIQVADLMLPHLKDRPIAFVRFPEGLKGERFFQKHWDKGQPKFLKIVSLWAESNDKDRDWILCNDLNTLLWLCQISALEIHSWYSRVTPLKGATTDFTGSDAALDASALNFPDFAVFDLDPNLKNTESTFDKRAYKKVIDVALETREVLAQVGLDAYLKTSGKTGLHLYVPIKRKYPYEEVKDWAEQLGRKVESLCQDEVTMEWSLEKRPNKIFIDHNQNVRGKTLVAVYSTRPAAGATVSYPIEWDEVEGIDPREFTIRTVPQFLKKRGDVWNDILAKPQELKSVSRASLR